MSVIGKVWCRWRRGEGGYWRKGFLEMSQNTLNSIAKFETGGGGGGIMEKRLLGNESEHFKFHR